MKKLLLLTGIIAGTMGFIGCGGAHGNDPGDAYMPDMYYSRAYEAYGYNNQADDHNPHGYDSLRMNYDDTAAGTVRAHYNGMPVPGSIARGDAFPFAIMEGDSGYAQAATYKSPAQPASFTAAQMKEAERLFLVNCAICHGKGLDGNGPLYNDGNGPYPAAPRNLLDAYTKGKSDAQIYHVITYGKGQMGSYASQVHPEQRWWIINYIRSKQGPATAKADSTASKAAGQSASSTTGMPATPAPAASGTTPPSTKGGKR